mmetsp:Transcript_58353/g.165689  ORF Transcript_58353/g.165689 Transcript_58353/m.165689 type:complete len:309 (+) Transcript_58353:2-928(+)
MADVVRRGVRGLPAPLQPRRVLCELRELRPGYELDIGWHWRCSADCGGTAAGGEARRQGHPFPRGLPRGLAVPRDGLAKRLPLHDPLLLLDGCPARAAHLAAGTGAEVGGLPRARLVAEAPCWRLRARRDGVHGRGALRWERDHELGGPGGLGARHGLRRLVRTLRDRVHGLPHAERAAELRGAPHRAALGALGVPHLRHLRGQLREHRLFLGGFLGRGLRLRHHLHLLGLLARLGEGVQHARAAAGLDLPEGHGRLRTDDVYDLPLLPREYGLGSARIAAVWRLHGPLRRFHVAVDRHDFPSVVLGG